MKTTRQQEAQRKANKRWLGLNGYTCACGRIAGMRDEAERMAVDGETHAMGGCEDDVMPTEADVVELARLI